MVSSIGVLGVPAVDLVQVHVVRAEAAQGVVDAGQDVLARQAPVVGPGSHDAAHLGGQHVVVAAGEDLAQQPAGDLLADALRVDVRGVEEVDARLGRPRHQRLGRLLVENPIAP
jgi:hypothetical protein